MAELEALDQFDFHHRLAGQSGASLVLFTSPDCGSCRQWQRLLTTFDAGRPLALFQVDVQRDAALAAEFGLFHLPALVLYSDGDFHAQLQCEAAPAALRACLRDALSRPAEDAP